MPISKVLSIRVELPTLAGCYRLIELSGQRIKGRPMGSAIRIVIESAIHTAIEDEVIPRMSEQEAALYLASLGLSDVGQTVRLKLNTPSIQTEDRSPFIPIDAPDGAYAEMAAEEDARDEVAAQMNPIVSAAQKAVDKRRFEGVETDLEVNLDVGETDEPAPKLPPIPPWKQADKITSANLINMSGVSPTITGYLECEDQVGLMAARVILAKLPDGMLGGERAEGLISSTRKRFVQWLEQYPGNECQPSVDFGKTK